MTPTTQNTIVAAVGAIATDAVACAVAFGINLSEAERVSSLSLAGAITVTIVGAVAWIEAHKVKATADVRSAVIAQTPPGQFTVDQIHSLSQF